MRQLKFCRCAVLIAVSTTCVAGCGSVDIPEGPDLSAVWDAYADPQGSISQTNAEAVMNSAQAAFEEVQLLGEMKFVMTTLKPVADTIATVAGEEGSLEEVIRLSGVTDVKYTCPGLMPLGAHDPANGNITYKVTFKENWLQDVLWGKLDDCQIAVSGSTGILNGTWAVSLENQQHLRDLSLERVLFSLAITLDRDEVSEEIKTTFIVDQMDFIELQVPADNGYVVFGFGDSSSRATLRTASDTFCCNFEEKECLALNGTDCDDTDPGGQRISW